MEKYKRKTIVVAERDFNSGELWQCENCKRWHGPQNGADDRSFEWCDSCAVNNGNIQRRRDGK
jgi:hypothetical protein